MSGSVPAIDALRFRASHSYVFKADAEAMEAAADLLDAIDALHQSWPDSNWCSGCDVSWPCPTARLLHPEAGKS